MDLWARLAGGFAFRSQARHRARMAAFARAERGSQLDMMAAAADCDDDHRAAQYLRHAHDELRHARSFAARHRELGGDGWIDADGGGLFRELGEVRFLAFVHLGEDRARRRFRVLTKRLADPRTRAVLEALLPDEDRHASYTHQALTELSPSPRRELRRARRWDLWRSWQRLAANTTRLLHDTTMWGLYWTLWPLSVWVRRVRPGRRGWS